MLVNLLENFSILYYNIISAIIKSTEVYMNKQLALISARIKDLREFGGYSAEELANKASIDYRDYLKIEEAQVDIPIGRLYDIARALEVDPTVLLTGKDSIENEVAVVYSGNGTSVERYLGYNFTSLAGEFYGRKMEPMVVTLKAGPEPELVKHNGQEFNYVLEGQIRVLVGNREYYLRKGDSIYFNPTIPHAQISMEDESKFLTVILED